MEGSSFNSEWDEPALHKVLDEQRNKIKDLKHTKSKKPLPQILTIIDDFADRSDIMHSSTSILTTLLTRGKHFGSSCWLSSQKLTAIPTVARVNFRFVLFWRLRNTKEIQAPMGELSAVYPGKALYEIYEAAIGAETHSFWYVNHVAKAKDDMFFMRFEHKLLVV
jgi:hypothetical protein